MKEGKRLVQILGCCAFAFLIGFESFAATSTPDIPLCGGVVVPDIPFHVKQASRTGGPVELKLASQDKVHVIDIAFIYQGSITNKAKLLQSVEAAVLSANVIFARSNVNARLRTVAVKPDYHYDVSLAGLGLHEAAEEVRSILSKVRRDYGSDLVYALTAAGDEATAVPQTLMASQV